ncbi:hypothetical protein SAMN05216388_10812 [Halorientalis persicus]|uniref:Uncharacterized protein n=1 Tax=Halorientalis persicus TaxID=1367881 RepID=A0A1H8WVI2_9EURY|nr:hypothetical protein [Halorientalis persicus]SEP31632.1 hypothetical protein SAMN05216388_10812 [Halorientalis persicus]
MSRATSRPDKYVIETLDQPTKLSLIDVERENLYVVIVPMMAGFLIAQAFEFGLAGLALAVLFGLAGVAVLIAAPSHLTGPEWIRGIVYYVKAPKETHSTVDAAVEADNSLKRAIETDEDTREYSQIEKLYPEDSIIERTDGQLVGGVRIDPGPVTFNEGQRFTQLANQVTQFARNSATFEFQLYVTTNEYPLDDYIENLEDRRTDADIQSQETMQAIVDDQIRNHPRIINGGGKGMKSYYIFTSVSSSDVLSNTSSTSESPLSQLSKAPVVGSFVRVFMNASDTSTTSTNKKAKYDELQDRLQTIQQSLVAKTQGWDSEELTIEEWYLQTQKFWQGESPEYADAEKHLGQRPMSTRDEGNVPDEVEVAK